MLPASIIRDNAAPVNAQMAERGGYTSHQAQGRGFYLTSRGNP